MTYRYAQITSPKKSYYFPLKLSDASDPIPRLNFDAGGVQDVDDAIALVVIDACE